ncbi:myelomonocytic growth factor-like isoform X2 [Sceloporus undulatus]|nr:myelomonocytic growth factor-like isoform X2 [Sceloporus undulatus]
MCSAAPITESSGDPELIQFKWKNKEFVARMKVEIADLKELMHTDLNLGADNQLLFMQGFLGIGQVDHSHCQVATCNMGGCFKQLQAGLQTYYGYLSHIKQILPKYANRLSALQLDTSNLSTNIQLQMEESSLPVVTYPQTENQPTFLQVQREIGSYLVLRKFMMFMDIITRALNHCIV